jgi:hypothetical protein
MNNKNVVIVGSNPARVVLFILGKPRIFTNGLFFSVLCKNYVSPSIKAEYKK